MTSAEPEARQRGVRPQQAVESFLRELSSRHPGIAVLAAGPETRPYRYDAATAKSALHDDAGQGPAVVFPETAGQVQDVVRLAAGLGITVVPRGAGTGLSGGAAARPGQVVVSTGRLARVIEISPLDEVAVVEPGIINAELNAQLAPYGLFYAPDPASFDISTIGGNIATNAGGLRCANTV
ncbi:FAD-binding oxidoreductase [Pseudarthrobacter enclensis]|uniref:FAD-binding oxidoreductase n=1 Tax=Pseudarthrobacter enclensis TaxID=993070 RepID=UPI003EE0CC71